MNGLREVQSAFAAALFASDTGRIAPRIRANGLCGHRRVGIYRNHLTTSLTEALAAGYPVVNRLVGDDFFRSAAHCYLSAHPPREARLWRVGVEFPAFLSGFAPAAALPYLPDVARLEWACQEVIHAATGDLLDTAALGRIPEARLGALEFVLNPCCRLLRSPFPVVRIWSVNQPDYPGSQAVDLAGAGPDRVLVTRQDTRIELLRLTAGEHALLGGFARHLPLAVAAEQARHEEPGLDLGACLAAHAARGTLTGFRLPTNETAKE